jgi:hypothetical protein
MNDTAQATIAVEDWMHEEYDYVVRFDEITKLWTVVPF